MDYTYIQLVFIFINRVITKLNGMFQQMFMLTRHAFIPRMLIFLCILSLALYMTRRIFSGYR